MTAPPFGFMHDSVSSSGTPSSTPSLITSDLCFRANGASMPDVVREPEAERPCHRLEELRRGVRKRIAGERPERDAPDAALRAVDRRLGEQNDVASRQIDVLVRRVEGRRLAAKRPVRRPDTGRAR